MELTHEYKQTELGAIPRDWNVVRIGDVCQIVGRIGFRGYTVNDIVKEGSGAIAISPSNIHDGTVSFNKCTYISWEKYEESPEIKIQNGDIILVKTGSTFGKTAIVKGLAERATLNPQLVVLKKIKINNFYLSYMIGFRVVQDQISAFIVGGALPTLSQRLVAKFILPIPSTKAEQEAIAEALSDADALIESLDQLITKKRQIKQGAMQELLTGKRRLPGFSGEWEVKMIEEIADCLDYLRIPLNDSERRKLQGDYPYCGANGVLDYIDKYCVDDEVILMAEDGGYFDEYATRPIAYRMSGKFWVNNHAHILKSKPSFDQNYFFYSLVHRNILPFLANGTRAKLNKSEMNKIEIFQPVEKIEQTAIAAILSDMDTELAALASRLAKARQIKQGMMQVLLTGRIRLI